MNDQVRDDIAATLRELGLGDHARPGSMHDVVLMEILPAIRDLRERTRSEVTPAMLWNERFSRTREVR